MIEDKDMFLGREKELKQLRDEFETSGRSAVLVYGKRRVGKSTLIGEAAKVFKGTVINHLCVKSSYEGNLELLSRSVCLMLGFPVMKFPTIMDLMDFLKSLNRDILLVLDEYQYLKQSRKDSEVDSYMQTIIDSLPENMKIVLCGSYISVMKELLEEENPLFGRFTLIQHIEEFDYKDASLFYPELPVRDRIRYYSIFGGSPYVLSQLDYGKSLEQNIQENLLDENSILRTYIENVMLKEIQKAFDVRILEVIGNGKKRYNEIVSHLGVKDNGLLAKQIKNLMNMETIGIVYPINKPNDKKKQFYEIRDNLMRFYFTYIFGNDSLISKFGEKTFFANYIQASLNTFISFRLEGIVNQYFSHQAKEGKLSGVKDFGLYWYDDKATGRNGEFDCVLKVSDGYDFYEVKFYESPMDYRVCKKEEEQVRAIENLHCRKIGFVCSSGFSFDSDEYDLITGEELYI